MLAVKAVQTGSPDLGTSEANINLAQTILLASGTGAGKADRIYQKAFSIAGSGSLSTDLAGALVDILGNALVFAKVKAIIVITGANAGNIIVGGGSNCLAFLSDVSDKIPVKPNGFMALGTSGVGVTVTADTADILKLENAGGSTATGKLIVIGESA
jgi:hypothetical protein